MTSKEKEDYLWALEMASRIVPAFSDGGWGYGDLAFIANRLKDLKGIVKKEVVTE